MTNQENIAAILAADTPLKAARYAVDNPPAREIGRLLDQAVADHDEITRLRAEITRLNRISDGNMVVLINASKEVEAKDKVIEGLREELDEARQHVGAVTKELETAIEWIQERGTTAAKYAPTAKEIVPQLFAAASAARAWLRRAS